MPALEASLAQSAVSLIPGLGANGSIGNMGRSRSGLLSLGPIGLMLPLLPLQASVLLLAASANGSITDCCQRRGRFYPLPILPSGAMLQLELLVVIVLTATNRSNRSIAAVGSKRS